MSKKRLNRNPHQSLVDGIQKDEKENVVLLIPYSLSHKAVTYYEIQRDLFYIKSVCDELLKLVSMPREEISNEQFTIYEPALWFNVITFYGKCFTNYTEDSKPKLEESIFEEQENLIPTHNRMMEIRHKFVAHRGTTDLDHSEMVFIYSPETKIPNCKIKSVRVLNPFPEDILAYLEVVNYLINKLSQKVDKVSQAVIKEYFDLLGNDIKLGNNENIIWMKDTV